jgi:hypothetical protein
VDFGWNPCLQPAAAGSWTFSDVLVKPDRDNLLLLLLRFAALLCFAGWTWQHYYWEGPYGVLLWQESTYALVDADWDAFVGSGSNDGWVQRCIAAMFWPYLACTVLSLTATPRARLQQAALLLGAGGLATVAFANYVQDLRQLPTLVEHGGQVLSPVLLVLALTIGVRHQVTVAVAMLAFVAVFAGHGVYALGLWPTPPNFHGMTTVILGTSHEATTTILRVAGVLDVAACVGLLVPALRRPCALYAAFWGLLTALARPVAGMSTALHHWGADQFVHEAVLRAPHALIPLFLFCHWRPARSHDATTPAPAPRPKPAPLVSTNP